MQSIRQALAGLSLRPAGGPSFHDIQAELLTTAVVREFCLANPEVTQEMLERSIVKVDQAVTEYKRCQSCQAIEQCGNLMKGHVAKLVRKASYVDAVLTPCVKWKHAQEQKQRERLIRAHHIPQEVLRASFTAVAQERERLAAYWGLMEFALRVQPGHRSQRMRGIYIYGPLGVGKSFLLAATANTLSRRGISTLMVYTPDFFRECKEAIAEQTLTEKLQTLKTVPVLILDDIGAEMITPWVRDEILGTILQYRMAENLPTLYSSNYSIPLLEEHLSHSSKGGTELMKAKRMIERIIHYTDVFYVGAPNRRQIGDE